MDPVQHFQIPIDNVERAKKFYSDVFGWEITAQLTQCANCGHVAECGALLAFVGGPGTVLRCSVCKEVVVRIVRTDRRTYVDARGASFFRLPVSPDI